MAIEKCYASICFFELDPLGPKIFGFSEFLAALALMVLAWTIGDVRYRFRIKTAPIPLQTVTYFIVLSVGALTLLTDMWRAQGWMVPQGKIITPVAWQALLGGSFFITFLTWAWFAFIRPPKFGRNNSKRFAQTMYRHIIKGDPTELAIIADELTYSAKSLIQHAPGAYTTQGKSNHPPSKHEARIPSKTQIYANELLHLIADKRFCRSIVESSPITALAIFQEINSKGKYGIAIDIFARNIVREALLNTNSFLYHETDIYESGLIGHHKPLSQAMFANPQMVESIRPLIDPDLSGKRKWNPDQWSAYCRIVLISIHGYANSKYLDYSSIINKAKQYIGDAPSSLYKINGMNNSWDSDPVQILQVIVDFIQETIDILDKNGNASKVTLRVKVNYGHPRESIYDDLASTIFEIIYHASGVNSPWWECWQIQHNMIWSRLHHKLCGPAGKIIRFKLHRIIYDEITHMDKFRNFKSAKILSYCLNVMGLKLHKGDFLKENRPLHKAVLAWTKRNYANLHATQPHVAESCLVDRITYDAKNLRLVKTTPAEGLRNDPSFEYLDLDPARQPQE